MKRHLRSAPCLGSRWLRLKTNNGVKPSNSASSAYIGFDLEIETRALPRDPTLAIRAEKTFLEGDYGLPGIKAALDNRVTGDELTAAYQRALDALDECSALVKVGLSPTRRQPSARFSS